MLWFCHHCDTKMWGHCPTCLPEKREILWLPSALQQCQQASMNLSPSFRGHRETKPSRKKVLVSSESSRSGCEMVFRPYPLGKQGDPARWLTWGIYHVPCSYLYCLKSQNQWACKDQIQYNKHEMNSSASPQTTCSFTNPEIPKPLSRPHITARKRSIFHRQGIQVCPKDWRKCCMWERNSAALLST